MDNLAINDQPQALSQYSRHQIDRTYADQYESVLGHLICERGRSVKAALEDLRPIVSQTRRQTLSAVDWCQKLGFGGIGVGILVGAGMGMGFAILPILAGTISIKFWADSRSELPRRDAEYHLLKTTPNLPEALYAFHLRGVAAVKIVGAYDQLVSAIEARLEGDGAFTEAEVGEFLQVKVSGDMVLGNLTAATVGAVQDGESLVGSAAVAQTELQEAIAPSVAVAPSMVHSKILCPIEVLGRDPYQSMGLIGGQRTGKTYTAALHTQNVKRKLKAKIIYINLMDANGDAANDWTHADVCVTCHLRKLPPYEAKRMIKHVISVVNDFFNGVNQILVFDEWVGFTSKANQWPKKASQEAAASAIESKEAKSYIDPEGLGTSAIELMNLVMAVTGELCQSGKKQAKAIWLLSPMVKAGSMEPQGLVIKEVSPMAVAISRDESVSWTHPVTGLVQEVGFDDAGYRASIQNMGLPPVESIPKMGCVRMLYAKGTWYSLDNLPKLEQPTPTIATPQQSSDEWDGIPEVECDGPDSDQWDLIDRFAEETGQGYFNNPNFNSWLKKQTYVNGKVLKVSSSSALGRAPNQEPEKSTWTAEGRSEAPFDDSWDVLLRAIAAQAMISTGLDRSIIMSAVNTAQVLNSTGKETEAIALLQAQLP